MGTVLQNGSTRTLSDAEVAAYDAMFSDETYKAGARRFPALVPVTPEHPSVAENKAAWERLKAFDRPFVTAFSDWNPITAGGEKPSRSSSPVREGSFMSRLREEVTSYRRTHRTPSWRSSRGPRGRRIRLTAVEAEPQ